VLDDLPRAFLAVEGALEGVPAPIGDEVDALSGVGGPGAQGRVVEDERVPVGLVEVEDEVLAVVSSLFALQDA
jgi:hypothetical protein